MLFASREFNPFAPPSIDRRTAITWLGRIAAGTGVARSGCGQRVGAPTSPSIALGPGASFIPIEIGGQAIAEFIGRFDAVVPDPIPSHAVPGSPTNLIGQVSGNVVILSWTAAPGDPTTYIIEAGTSSGASDLAN